MADNSVFLADNASAKAITEQALQHINFYDRADIDTLKEFNIYLHRLVDRGQTSTVYYLIHELTTQQTIRYRSNGVTQLLHFACVYRGMNRLLRALTDFIVWVQCHLPDGNEPRFLLESFITGTIYDDNHNLYLKTPSIAHFLRGRSLMDVEPEFFRTLDYAIYLAGDQADDAKDIGVGNADLRYKVFNAILPQLVELITGEYSNSDRFADALYFLTGLYRNDQGRLCDARLSNPESAAYGLPKEHFRTNVELFFKPLTPAQMFKVPFAAYAHILPVFAEEGESLNVLERDCPAAKRLRGILDKEKSLSILQEAYRSDAQVRLSTPPKLRDLLLLESHVSGAHHND